MQNLLELKGISRRVSDRFSLRDVTLAVEPGQIVGFVGAKVSGKTKSLWRVLGRDHGYFCYRLLAHLYGNER